MEYLDDNHLKVKASGKKGEIELDSDVVLVCVGKKTFSDGLGLEEIGVAKDKRGFVEVDSNYETNISGVFAIGDLIPGPMLAHKAEEDGVACVEQMNGIAAHIDYNLVPELYIRIPKLPVWV